jgi:hypothetical protein
MVLFIMRYGKNPRNERQARYNDGSFYSKSDDAEHDELKERAYMKRQMDARRKVERLELIKELGNGII